MFRQPTAAPQSNDRSGPVNVRVILWQNGFSINEDGPLRSFDDPTNRAFLMALQVVCFNLRLTVILLF